MKSKNILIVYFSYTGNTEAFAKKIGKITNGTIYKIQVPQEYIENVDKLMACYAKGDSEEKMAKYKKKLYDIEITKFDKKISDYDIIFIGSPIWDRTISPPVVEFLKQNNLAGKVVVPFVSHGGWGPGKSFEDIAKLTQGATVKDGLAISERSIPTEKKLVEWINKAIN
ncbi:flavodoxin [Lentisphaerota bacterium WC36G]|nr:flavodoxin [Lentisphaerae bacterium WC36]